MSVMEQLIAEIRKSLDEGSITMAALARAGDCSRQHLYGVLDGRHRLSLDKAEKLAKAVGLELVCTPSRKKVCA